MKKRDSRIREKLEEKAKEELLKKVLTEALTKSGKLDKEAAKGIAGSVASAILTVATIASEKNKIDLKQAFLAVITATKTTSVLETELNIMFFVNKFYNKAGISGTPFAEFAKLVATLKLSGDYAKTVNQKAKAGEYKELQTAMSAEIKAEDKAIKEKDKDKKKK